MTNQCRHLELLRREDGKYWDCGGCGERFTLVPYSDEPNCRPATAEETAEIDEAVAAGRIDFEPGWNAPRCSECGALIDNR